MDFAKAILDVRNQTYRHLQLILKVIPFETFTNIELGAQMRIRVMLFDANHYPGAVMFLIEGDGKAIFYTGNIRAEPWWVTSISRNLVSIPRRLGGKYLDYLYLDMTFASKEDIFQEFPPKAARPRELQEKIDRYSPEKKSYFRAWTFGYEDVWRFFSADVKSKIHVDEYQPRLYCSLNEGSRDGFSIPEAPTLNVFQAGNHMQLGCLATDGGCVRLHTCEPWTLCHAKFIKKKDLVLITPIIKRSRDGREMYEMSAGGGGGNLYPTAELDVTDLVSVEALADLYI